MASRRAWLLPLALFLVVETVYLANGRTLGNNDTMPARYLPFSLTVVMRDKPPGRYVWHAGLFEPDGVRLVARASAMFTVSVE
jgi:hypothetical protein